MKDAFCNIQLMPTTTTASGITTAAINISNFSTFLNNNNNNNNNINNNNNNSNNNNNFNNYHKSTITPGLLTTSINNMTNNICSSESFSIIPPPHLDMLSANSIELNAAASLSDDSGVPLTTNSSISSGDSYRLGMCKLEIELGESDGEVSQFDSLDNCSEGGMSAENFNTLKKGPLAPIDPPPEFQDSPQTTLVRSISKNIFNSLRRWTSSQSSFEHLKDHSNNDNDNCENNSELMLSMKNNDNHQQQQPQLEQHQIQLEPLQQQQQQQHQYYCTQQHQLQEQVVNSGSNENLASYAQQHAYHQQSTNLSGRASTTSGVAIDFANITIQDYSESNRCLRDAYAINKHLYSSDSILNSHTENIYDEPNNVGSNSLSNSVDVFDDTETIATAAASVETESVSPSLPPPPPPVSIVKIKQTLCPYYQDHTRYFKAIPSEQDYITSAAQRFDLSGLSEIHDYDLYYGSSRRNTYHQQYDTYLQRKLLSPLNLTTLHHCHHHGHYYAGVNSYSNRPNSRNSLNSRLSSSYNSLSMSSSNKPDDSIFITQAMSHDALLTREISDFYNVPIDSDIYAFPVDMIQTDKDCCLQQQKQKQQQLLLHNNNNTLKNNIKNNNNNEIASTTTTTTTKRNTDFIFMEHNSSRTSHHNHHNKLARRINRNKRKKRSANINNITNNGEDTDEGRFSNKYRTPVHCNNIDPVSGGCCGGGGGVGSDENGLLSDEVATITTTITTNAISATQEPLHMTLDEVKQFYHTLYSDGLTTTTTTMTRTTTQRTSSSSTTLLQRLQQCNKNNATKSSNETIWSSSSTHSRSKNAINNNNNNNNNMNNNNNNMNNNNSNNNISSNSSNHSGGSNHNNNKHTTKTNAKQKLLLNNENNNNNNNNNNLNIIGLQNHQSSHVSSCVEDQKQQQHEVKKSQFTLNLKQKFCSIFRFRKNYRGCRSNSVVSESDENVNNNNNNNRGGQNEDKRKKFQSRALPPLPKKAIESAADITGVLVDCGEILSKTGTGEIEPGTSPTAANVAAFEGNKKSQTRAFQFTSSIEKVKDYGWYWGPLSSEAAEKVLSNEPDGSFIVRDSSDDHYIFSLSFKLNNCVRHVRIEQDQGTFSFGSYAKFKSQTITEFIEKAVEHSRSGRYLFFLHRRPEHGPMRVQLTNPVSRFKHVQSLQHMCRFVILKTVIRKDLIQTLPLPRRLLDYLNYKHCYSEQVESDSTHSQASGDGSI